MTSPASSSRSSPSSSFRSFRSRVRAPVTDLDSAILSSPVSVSALPSHQHPQPYRIRRQPSAIDLALQEEILYANEVETIGLGLLEPRPRANTASSTGSAASQQQCSIMEFMHETAVTPVVLDSIFDVMERS
ncbi:hypothetical protein A1O7_02245 [Cladophialophora yegresii CBS 114405]|uniref:Uncharacterized protein n=1 Tax=Cladophialophora yegresii CBS 114405 TaxID=1182544 RepID=W9W9X6_9EURO|nr:uncharacterized protein A1O7_02245 [Cladophialophora yegresii CBS 114405]EXJ61815.1 hypothetical protein A1O7_02245 [Cladophialophora yegresii CBS 114405]